jgi:hypothetical protein
LAIALCVGRKSMSVGPSSMELDSRNTMATLMTLNAGSLESVNDTTPSRFASPRKNTDPVFEHSGDNEYVPVSLPYGAGSSPE